MESTSQSSAVEDASGLGREDDREQPRYRIRQTCRACNSSALISVLDLGSQPLANGFREISDESPEARYPLYLVRCAVCELVQLTVVVDPRVLYGSHYPYRSGASEGWAAHCHALAKEIGGHKTVLEIGCLDGVLLRHCRENGCEVQGVDPSSPVMDLPVIREHFGRDWTCLHTGRFDVIVVQNVFGHVDDVKGFLAGVVANLAPDGVVIIECPWVIDLIDGVKWDTIYHEHLSYWGLRPLRWVASSVGLTVNQTRSFSQLHGGTMRYYLSRSPKVHPSVQATLGDEEMDEIDWKRFRQRARSQINAWSTWFSGNIERRIGAYGASAKLNTFLNALCVFPALIAVLDDTPEKHGLLTPGLHYQVVQPAPSWVRAMDVILVGSPNWKAEIEAKARAMGFVGEVKSLWD